MPVRIGDQIGSGSYGIVYLATNKTTHEEKALKQTFLQDGQLSSSQIDELSFSQQFDSPYILKIEKAFFDSRGDKIHMFLLTEYCSGINLRKIVERKMKSREDIKPEVCFLLVFFFFFTV